LDFFSLQATAVDSCGTGVTYDGAPES